MMIEQSYEEIIEKFKEAAETIKRKEMYIDILYDYSSVTRIYRSRTEEQLTIRPELEGFVVRGYKAGKWREYGLLNLEDLPSTLEKIKKIEKPAQQQVNLREFEGWTLNKEIQGKFPPETIPIHEKVEKVREIQSEIQKVDSRIINPIVVYDESTMERIFVNNEGCVLRQRIPRTRIFIQPIAKEGNRVEFDYFSTSGEVGFELFDKISGNLIHNIVENSIASLKAEKAPSGTLPIIVDHDMAGLIAHESFGHGLEADQILRDRSYLKKFINKPVASEICNLCDSPVLEGEIGSFFFDDEGIRTKKTLLVENGILKNLLHDRYSASALNLSPSGNGRRESFSHKLHVRMTNTYFESGDYSYEEMLEGIKYGVVLIRGYYGMEDPLAGGMQVTSKKGYLVENGEQTKLLGAITVSGYVIDVLKSIDAIGKGPVEFRGGTCGKGHEDYVPVTTGGPYIRTQKAVVSPA